MIRIGLTGTVAAGKSTVGDLFEEWGARRADADRFARTAVEPGSAGLDRVVERFGPGVLDEDGALDRRALRRLVFSDAEARADLERIVHAEVRRLREAWRARQKADGAAVIVEEIPLLYENGLEGEYDVIVVVDAPVDLRRGRASEARGWTDEEFAAVDAAQLPAEEKRARADQVIWNDGDREALTDAAADAWAEIGAGSPPQPGREPRD